MTLLCTDCLCRESIPPFHLCQHCRERKAAAKRARRARLREERAAAVTSAVGAADALLGAVGWGRVVTSEPTPPEPLCVEIDGPLPEPVATLAKPAESSSSPESVASPVATAPVAQTVERRTCNADAASPILAGGSVRDSRTENAAPSDADILRAENRELLSEVTRLRGAALTEERVRRELLHLADAPRRVPDWLLRTDSERGCYGVPTLFLSDQHLGEVVDPAQVGGVNEYSLEIARRRWRRTTEKAIDLCHNFLARPLFDGAVLALGGDSISGDIHEELSATNETDILPTVLEVADLIVWSVRQFKQAFGRVFVPAVVGNHPRLTHKPRAKGATFTNLDWLAYQMAAREFRGDEAVTFDIPSGTDANWRVYAHRYAMTHGNQFRGGDGIIGPIGPIFRGDQKKRSRQAQVNAAYNTLLVAHYHQLAMELRIIRNGSLKGYDEFAFVNNFPYEPPMQAFWITHPSHGITFSIPVLCEEPAAATGEPWVSWKAA